MIKCSMYFVIQSLVSWKKKNKSIVTRSGTITGAAKRWYVLSISIVNIIKKKIIKTLSHTLGLRALYKANCSIRVDLCVLFQIPIYSEVTLNPFIIYLSYSKISLMDFFLENSRDTRLPLAKEKISRSQSIWLKRQHWTKTGNRMAGRWDT